MENQFRNNIHKLYRNNDLESLKNSLSHCRKQFRKTQSEHDAVRCEIIFGLIAQKEKEK